MAELIEDLPEGLLQIVYGAGEVGEMLVRHPGVDKVLKMSGFNNIAKVFSSQAEAVSSFGS